MDLLFNAAKAGDLETVSTQIYNGVDVNVTDQDGYTAIMWAAVRGHIDVFQFLLDAGTDLTIETDDGWKVSDIAKNWNQTSMLELLHNKQNPTVQPPPTPASNNQSVVQQTALAPPPPTPPAAATTPAATNSDDVQKLRDDIASMKEDLRKELKALGERLSAKVSTIERKLAQIHKILQEQNSN